jgi:large subunit ribosomal protein L10
MALTRKEKNDVVEEINNLLASSKLTVAATYQGTTVKQMQELRRQAKDNSTIVKVVKNRLVKKAVEGNDTLKSVDTAALTGQLLYAFNADDEVAPAQVLAKFAKTAPSITFVGAITADGKFMEASEVETLAKLPSKTQLIAGIINTLNAPTNNVMGALKGNLHGLLDAVAAKASN